MTLERRAASFTLFQVQKLIFFSLLAQFLLWNADWRPLPGHSNPQLKLVEQPIRSSIIATTGNFVI